MIITFDPVKSAANIAKHGVSLADAALLYWDRALIRYDDRHDYGETRMVAFGLIGSRLHIVVFVERNNTYRIISLSKANKREEAIYAKAQA